MNWNSMKLGVKLFAHKVVYFCKHYAPQIMVGGGLAAGGATVVMACKATLKTQDILDEKDRALEQAGTDEEQKVAKKTARVSLVKTWAPVGTVGAASVALILGGHHILGRRAAEALGAAYAAQKKLFEQNKAIEEAFGEEVAEKIKNGLPIDKLEVGEKLKKLDAEEKKNPKPKAERYTVDWLFCEEGCGARFRGHGCWQDDAETNLNTVLRKQQMANDLLRARHSLTVNNILTELFDADPIDAGTETAWVWDEKYGYDVIDFGLGELNTVDGRRAFRNKGEPNVWLRFNVRQKPEVISLNEISQRKRSKEPLRHYWH